MARILLIEDEDAIRRGLVDLLAYHGHQPLPEADGDRGLERAVTETWDLLLVDVMLPGTDGFTIARQARAEHPSRGILMLTAKGSEQDILQGFAAGCDDYVTKPFSIAQLLARVDALLRRSAGPSLRQIGPLALDTDHLAVRGPLGSRQLSQRDVELLAYLIDQDRVVAREDLLREVWGYARVEAVETRAIDMHLVKLRRKLEAVIAEPVIETVRGAGYRLHLELRR